MSARFEPASARADDTMNAMRLTVGIPTYNRAHMLNETIASVLAQSYASFRLIVSDNGSEDATREVVQSYGDDRIVYSRSDRNVGPIGNFNRLIGLADTEFLVLLPDDDVLYPGHLESVVDVLDRHQNVGLAHSAFDLIDETSQIVRHMDPLASRSPVTIERRDAALERLMVSGWPICFPSVAYRTSAIVDAGGLREEEGPFGDIQLWMRIALAWDFAYVARTLAGFRVHPETASRNLGVERGVTSDGDDLVRVQAQTRFERRMDFLDHAPLEQRRARWLRAVATLQLLVEQANLGLPWTEVAKRIASVVRACPRILLRPALWRLVLAQLGARRARSALRRVSAHLRR